MHTHHIHTQWTLTAAPADPADCQQEQEPLSSGRCFVLLYSLVYMGEGSPPSAADPSGGAVASVLRAVAAWAADPEGPDKLCLLLEGRWVGREGQGRPGNARQGK